MKKAYLFGAIFILLFLISCKNTNTITTNAVTDIDSEYIKIPLSDLSNNLKFYSFNDNYVNINYFAILGSDGKPRTAFDACDVCGGLKGYKQERQNIVCNTCGQVFDIDGLGTKNKDYGCWPSYLPNKIEGDNLLIKISDLIKDRNKFIKRG